MADYKRRADTLSKKEQDAARDMKVVQEMYARGFEFVPIDIFSAQSRSFQVVGDKIMPSLSSIDGLGEKAADAIVEAAKDGPFLSKDDFRQRTKVSKTVVDLMDTLNLLGNLPESNQIACLFCHIELSGMRNASLFLYGIYKKRSGSLNKRSGNRRK